MVEEIRTIGPSDGLHFEFHFDFGPSSTSNQAWGGARLFFADEVIWAAENENDEEAPLDWSWFDLLAYLSLNWPWIVLEQHYPIPVNPLYPGMLYQEAERRWQDLSEAEAEEEEILVYEFTLRHDLALALKGAFVPTVIILRHGEDCLIWLDALKKNEIRPFQEVIKTLESVGNFLAEIVGENSTGYAREIVNKWRKRGVFSDEMKLDILSGMEPVARKRLEGGADPLMFWDLSTDDSELLAVARMTSAVYSQDIQTILITEIRAVNRHDTEELDNISAKAVSVVDQNALPWEQGYMLAEWLRGELEIRDDQLVRPECLLSDWHVDIRNIKLPYSAFALDAVAAWGPRHGPVVVLNCSEGARFTTQNRMRTTLAHEICHMLLDRERGLPMAEVLGGMTPKLLEQRARAFAAEFLLPRTLAIEAMRGKGSVESILLELSDKYQVSFEVAARQVVNSPDIKTIYKPDLEELKRIVARFAVEKER
jgi:Zn-dependent peptidase ImmA (M78 family)